MGIKAGGGGGWCRFRRVRLAEVAEADWCFLFSFSSEFWDCVWPAFSGYDTITRHGRGFILLLSHGVSARKGRERERERGEDPSRVEQKEHNITQHNHGEGVLSILGMS